MRVLLDEGDPEKVRALEEAFIANTVTEDVLFATGRGVAPWMASVTFGGRGPADGVHRLVEGEPDSVFSRAGARPSDGALERDAIGAEIDETGENSR